MSPKAQSVASLIANPVLVSSIQAWSHTFVEIDHELFYNAILLRPDSSRVGVSYKRKYMYVHEVPVNCLVKLSKEKKRLR